MVSVHCPSFVTNVKDYRQDSLVTNSLVTLNPIVTKGGLKMHLGEPSYYGAAAGHML